MVPIRSTGGRCAGALDEKGLRRLGGPLNVYKEDWKTLKFRRKRDAFAFMVFRNL
jgi:hypothetical protein